MAPGVGTADRIVFGFAWGSMYGGEEKCIQSFGGGYLEERNHLHYLVVDGRVILKWILENQYGRLWTVFILLKIGTNGGLS